MPVSFRIVCCVANQMHLDADQIWLDTNQCTLMQYIQLRIKCFLKVNPMDTVNFETLCAF